MNKGHRHNNHVVSLNMSLIIEASAIITALSAIGVFGFTYRIFALVREHDRVLFGEDSVKGWNGLLGMVHEHRKELEKMEETNL